MFVVLRRAVLLNRPLNLAFGLFSGGGNRGSGADNYVTNTGEYGFETGTVTVGVSMQTPRRNHAAISNTQFGLMCGGQNFTTDSLSAVERYQFSSKSIINASNLTTGRQAASAIGTTDRGIIEGGINVNTSSSENVYYDSNVRSVGTNLTSSHYNAAATSAPSFGLFASGQISGYNYTRGITKYTYSNSAVISATSLSLARMWYAATGNKTVGIFGGGNNSGIGASAATSTNTTEKYTYANNAVSAGSNLSQIHYASAAAGNDKVGIFALGTGNVRTAATNRYTYENDTVVPATNLEIAQSSRRAFSSTPGHL